MESQLQQQQPDGTSTAPTASPPAAAEVPVDLRCPITYQLLRDPVILADSGQTYERAAIEEWLSRGNMRDPITGVLCVFAARWWLGVLFEFGVPGVC